MPVREAQERPVSLPDGEFARSRAKVSLFGRIQPRAIASNGAAGVRGLPPDAQHRQVARRIAPNGGGEVANSAASGVPSVRSRFWLAAPS
jgi:hypothetical protein